MLLGNSEIEYIAKPDVIPYDKSKMKQHLEVVMQGMLDMQKIAYRYYGSSGEYFRDSEELNEIYNKIYNDIIYIRDVSNRPEDISYFYAASQKAFAALQKSLNYEMSEANKENAMQRLSKAMEIYANLSVLQK